MNRCQIEGMLFLCRYLLEYSKDPELTLFAMGCIEQLKDMVLKKFQLDKAEPDEHIEDFLYDIQIYFDFNGNGYKSRISDQYCYYTKDENGKIQGPQNHFFGNVLEPALRQFDQISVEAETKVKKPQRRKGYNDKGSTRPLHHWKPSSDFSLEDDQNYSYRHRLELEQVYHLHSGLFGLDYDESRSRGRSIDSLFVNLNYKNPERNDEYYVKRKPKFRKTKKQQHRGESYSQDFETASRTRTSRRENEKHSVGCEPARQPYFKPGPPNRDSEEISIKITGGKKLKEQTAQGPYAKLIEENWNKRFLK